MRFNVAVIAAFAASAMALRVKTPHQDDKVDLSKEYKIEWDSVQSDAEKINIFLVNSNGSNVNKEVASDVDTSEGEYNIKPVSGIHKGKQFQFNIESASKNSTSGLLAQSQHFEVTGVAAPPTTGKKRSLITPAPAPAPSSPQLSQVLSQALPQPPASHCTTKPKPKIKTTSRPCIRHTTHLPSSTIPSGSITPASHTHTSSATETASTPTHSTAGSSSLTIPAAGSLLMSLFAFAL